MTGPALPTSDDVMVAPARPARKVLGTELLLVLGVSLGASAVLATLRLAERLTRAEALSAQTAALNVSRLPDRPWFDIADQLARISLGVVPVLLALYLLDRYPGRGARLIGFDFRRFDFDLGSGAVLAAVIGLPGLALYVAAVYMGFGVRIVPSALAHSMWVAAPLLGLAALQNALLEEVVGVGYMLRRLADLGWPVAAAIAAHALLRGSYHFYQGFGGFVGNAVMGVVFALFYLRFRRVMPLVIAHTLLDVVAFLGYDLFAEEIDAALADVLSWLP